MLEDLLRCFGGMFYFGHFCRFSDLIVTFPRQNVKTYCNLQVLFPLTKIVAPKSKRRTIFNLFLCLNSSRSWVPFTELLASSIQRCWQHVACDVLMHYTCIFLLKSQLFKNLKDISGIFRGVVLKSSASGINCWTGIDVHHFFDRCT